MLRNGSASTSDRTLCCPAWLCLPHVYHEAGPYAARGTGLHAFIQRVIAGTPAADALELVPEDDRPTAACVDWTRLLAGLSEVRAEAAYALDVQARTARYLGSNIGRAYERAALAQGAPIGPWEVPGSADLEGVDGAGLAVTGDIKSGFRQVTAAEANGQLLHLAACRMLAEDRDEVEVRVCRLKASGAVYAGDRATITRWDVDEFCDAYAEALRLRDEAAATLAAGGVPDVCESDECRHCPAFNACPAKHALVRAALPALADIDARIASMTREEAGTAIDWVKRAKAVIERIEKPLNERVHREGWLPLPGGEKIAKSISYQQARFSTSLARGLLTQLGATADQMARCYEQGTVTKMQIVNDPNALKKPRARKPRVKAAEAPMAGALPQETDVPSVPQGGDDDESIPF